MKKFIMLFIFIGYYAGLACASEVNYSYSSAEYPSDGSVIVKEYEGQMDASKDENKKSKSFIKKIPRVVKPAIYNPNDLNAGSYYSRQYIGY